MEGNMAMEHTRPEVLEIYNRSRFDPGVVRKGFELGNKFHEWLLQSEYNQNDIIIFDPRAADGTMMRILGDTVKNIYVMDSEKRNRAILHRDRRWKVVHSVDEISENEDDPGKSAVVISLSRYVPEELQALGIDIVKTFCLDISGEPVVNLP